jgi:PAS domain S-box-containing protein
MSPVHALSPLQRLERLNRLYQVLSGTNEAVVRSQSDSDLFLAACRVAVERGGFLLAAVVAPEAVTGRVRPLVHFGDDSGYFNEIHVNIDDEKLKQGTSATAMRTGRHDVCNDVGTEPRMAPWREQTQRRGFRASAAFPLMLDGSVFGALVLFAGEPGYFQQDEVDLLVRVAGDVSFAVSHLRRESQRRATQEALVRSEQQNKLILQSVGEGILGVDTAGCVTFENPAALAMLGWVGHTLVGRDVHEVLYGPGAVCPGSACPFAKTMRDGLLLRVPDDTFVQKDGAVLRVEYVCSPVTHGQGRTSGAVISFSDVGDDRRARDKLRESLSVLRMAGRVARLGGWTIDLPGYKLTWSDENCAIHDVPPGYQPTLEEGIGYFLPEHRAQVRALVEGLRARRHAIPDRAAQANGYRKAHLGTFGGRGRARRRRVHHTAAGRVPGHHAAPPGTGGAAPFGGPLSPVVRQQPRRCDHGPARRRHRGGQPQRLHHLRHERAGPDTRRPQWPCRRERRAPGPDAGGAPSRRRGQWRAEDAAWGQPAF